MCDTSFSTSNYPKFGYDVDRIEEINPRLKCIFCYLIIHNPIQLTECGHRCCRECFDTRVADTTDGNIECPCDDCHLKTNKNDIMPDKAFQRELNNTYIICMYRKENCSWTGQLKDYQLHLDKKHAHYTCGECHENFSTKTEYYEHITKTCSKIFQFCPLTPFCIEERIHKNDLLKHLLSKEHQEVLNKVLTGEYVLPETTLNREQENESNQTNKEIEEAVSSKLINLTNEVHNLNNKTVNLDSTFTDLTKKYHSAVQELNNFQSAINERNLIKQSLQPNQEKIQKDIEEIQEMCNNNQYVSTDGILTWRVENVAGKMADAQSERQTSIYSPIFYSSPSGYKMRVRLFLFGDGNARRTHMSLFFLIMKGEHDAILKWPFHYKITFCLLDQTGNNRHIIDSFFPDVKSNSFQRPKESANIASGIPKFFPLPMLLQDDNPYVRDDTLYIKIIVALNDISKSMLPYMLTLNPALPSHIQENLINQETIKQQQPNNMTSSQTMPMNIGT